MKDQTFGIRGAHICWAVPIGLLLVTTPAEANALREMGKHSDDAIKLIPILLGMFGNLAGLAATVASGVWARGKAESQVGLSAIIAAIGGIWSAVAWFGWPMSKRIIPGGLFAPPREVSQFSFFGLIGIGVFAVLGLVAWAAIAYSGDRKDKG